MDDELDVNTSGGPDGGGAVGEFDPTRVTYQRQRRGRCWVTRRSRRGELMAQGAEVLLSRDPERYISDPHEE